MSDPLVLVEARPDGVTLLRLNRPPLNPLSTALLRELEAIAVDITADESVKAVVVTGSEKAFAAGADVAEFTADGAAAVVSAGIRAGFDALAAIPRPGHRRDQRVRARWGTGARRWRATCGWRRSRRASGCPRSSSASSPAVAVRSAWRARRSGEDQGAGVERPARARRRSARHRAGRPGGRGRRGARHRARVGGDAGVGRGRRHGSRQARHRRRARRLARRRPRPRGRRASSRCSPPTTPRSASAASSTTAPAKPPSPAADREPASAKGSDPTLVTPVWRSGAADGGLRGGGLEVLGVGGEEEAGLHRLVGGRVPRLHERGVRRVERASVGRVERLRSCRRGSRSWCRSARDPRASPPARRPAGCGSRPSRCRSRRARTAAAVSPVVCSRGALGGAVPSTTQRVQGVDRRCGST